MNPTSSQLRCLQPLSSGFMRLYLRQKGPKSTMDESYPSNAREIEGVRKIRARKIRFLLLFLLLPVNLLAHILIDYALISDYMEIITFLTLFILMLWAMISLAFTRCPRCNTSLFSTSAWGNPLSDRCFNCGLRFKYK